MNLVEGLAQLVRHVVEQFQNCIRHLLVGAVRCRVDLRHVAANEFCSKVSAVQTVQSNDLEVLLVVEDFRVG